MNGLLGLTYRYRSVGGDTLGNANRGFQKLRGFNDPIDQPPRFGLLGGEGKARQDNLLRPALANGPGKILGSPCSRHYSKRNLRQRKARICGRIDEIRSRGDLAAAPVGRAVDGSHQRNWTSCDRPNHSFENCVLRPPAFIGHAVAFLQIPAGAKRLFAAAGNNRGAQPLQIDREGLEQFHEIEPHTRIHRVRHLGPIERDKKEVIVAPRNGNSLDISAHLDLLFPATRVLAENWSQGIWRLLQHYPPKTVFEQPAPSSVGDGHVRCASSSVTSLASS